MQGISESEITIKITADGETRDLKLTKKQSGALKAIAYIEGMDVFEKIRWAIVSALGYEVEMKLELDE